MFVGSHRESARSNLHETMALLTRKIFKGKFSVTTERE